MIDTFFVGVLEIWLERKKRKKRQRNQLIDHCQAFWEVLSG